MNDRHPFHSICPYFAMFPPGFVRRNVLAWSKPNDIIFDPFSGRGTTIFESLLNRRRAIGCDTNPVAVCLSRAKANPPSLDEIDHRIAQLEMEARRFSTDTPESNDEFFTLCFHGTTLRQLVFLKRELRWRVSRTDCFIAALALGCLHGESHRTSLCFSNRMPRTISTKPAYSIRWWREKNSRPPERDVFSILRACAEFRYRSPIPSQRGRVVEGDARRAKTLLQSYRGRVKLVVTSPPYLDITDYREDQWLRLWLLGGSTRLIAGQGKDDRHRRIELYWEFLKEVWQGIVPLLQDSAQLVIRIGGTRLAEAQLRAGLGETLHASGRTFILEEFKESPIQNGQRRSFLAAAPTPSIEYDYRFRLV